MNPLEDINDEILGFAVIVKDQFEVFMGSGIPLYKNVELDFLKTHLEESCKIATKGNEKWKKIVGQENKNYQNAMFSYKLVINQINQEIKGRADSLNKLLNDYEELK